MYEKPETERLKKALEECEGILIGAGAGLSTSAGFTYTGERFKKYFSDFEEKYGFHDMYTGGFYPYDSREEYWAYWSRYIYINRYADAPEPVYENLLSLVEDKDYFVLTTNVDHCFQKAGFDKERLFYTQGDYGLFQCSKPCCDKTWDNEETVRRMMEEQRNMRVPRELIPYCPNCGRPLTVNLRADDRFVEDEGWHKASLRYREFLKGHRRNRILYLELGVGFNTPGIIKYPFWQMTCQNPKATYACINYGDAAAPKEIAERSICIDGDIGAVLEKLK
ncbi:MAG TPA: Sir2 silent information regulator family NAD-dependent deacetylase [Candidatus Copromorpha excrementigallinarum]|uniref:Sir2 silent information regulator family NAD-dependent deacetylase n=1 Tax=Candidatus Allocopromorpha excrementigallinarum TaxID=2840742 RepID=A0A9D1L652_9FIRM|nr:Sir2 silent information regulator family NAD-dependent deacetylase [Candidatus Copromorpha excrementigallinarum]